MIIAQDLIIILSVLVFMLIETIALILYLNKQNAPVRTTVIQWVSVTLFIPIVFLLSYFGKINENTVATLLGAFAGYVLGKTGLTEEWTHTKQG